MGDLFDRSGCVPLPNCTAANSIGDVGLSDAMDYGALSAEVSVFK